MTGTNCKNHWSWRLISPSRTLSTRRQSSSQIIAHVHSPSNHPTTSSPYCYLCCSFAPQYLYLHNNLLHIYHSYLIAIFELFCHYGLFIALPPLSYLIPTLYINFFYCIMDCVFVYSMCNSVLFVTHCFALSWPGRSCKWELVLNWLTWLNKGEINKSYTHLWTPLKLTPHIFNGV
jgi:hypothetical protein